MSRTGIYDLSKAGCVHYLHVDKDGLNTVELLLLEYVSTFAESI